MGLLGNLVAGFADILHLSNLLAIAFGVSFGIVVGALPGLTATMSVAIMTPLTFAMSPDIGISMLLGVYVGAIYGGSITAILVRTPGTPAAICTAFDGYPLAQRGRADEALVTALVASATGGILSAVILILVAPQLATVALRFGAPEYFGLTVFGMSIIAAVSGKSIVKGLISGCLGIFLSTVGMDPFSGVARFTFGRTALLSGFELLPVLIGVFALSEVFARSMENPRTIEQIVSKPDISLRSVGFALRHWRKTIVSGLIGTFVGIVPGTGGGIASFIAYAQAKRTSRHPEEYGDGSTEGIAAAESANNATTGGALVPMLTLGVPGDPTTAVLIGAFMIQGMTPGPLLFQTDGPLVFALFAGLLIANIFMLILGFAGLPLFARVTNIPRYVLSPLIMALCFVGAYAVANSIVSVFVMVAMGVVGLFLRRHEYPGGPLVIGMILGPMVERSLRQALTQSRGSVMIFLTRPIAVVFLVLTVVSLLYPVIKRRIDERNTRSETRISGGSYDE